MSWNIFFQLKIKKYNKNNYTRFIYNKIITISVYVVQKIHIYLPIENNLNTLS